MDAGTVPQLQSPQRRFWRMPLPGIFAYRRRDSHCSSLLISAFASHRASCGPKRNPGKHLRRTLDVSAPPAGWALLAEGSRPRLDLIAAAQYKFLRCQFTRSRAAGV